ncbi:methionine aminotransferase [Parasegetibacter sp. NRK P23]|uniref:methionine aminotransferase n=1 Tax=Parasegetibacter sp. NRK P23 TaxID=2942999 RepID=UPI0020442228|nr:methionine aminotransferase [Parasegetibacter sp. NRK P23]MCM5529864.1 methionine aminotransferase [Parasegetibacter sp. NRK P23]
MMFTSKLPNVGTTIFTVMSALAAEHKAVNLGQGFPDFPMEPALPELVHRAMLDGWNQYTHTNGYAPLREVLAKKIKLLYQAEVHPETMITITPGGTYAIYSAFTAVLRPGDEVIVFQPCYDSYVPNIELNGATPVFVNLEFPDYRINWEKVKEKITPRTRMIVLNSPHNPTGAVLSAEDIAALRELVAGTDILLLSDEVYEHLVYNGKQHLSMLRYPDLLARAFVCFSFGKVFHCTGWKLGYCVAPPDLMREFRKVHQFNCFSCFSPAQVALTAYFSDPWTYLGLSGFMEQKKIYFGQLMAATAFTPLASHGSYFQCFSYENISKEPAIAFAKRLTTEAGVAAIPVSAFYLDGTDDRVLRFCFAKKEETLEQAVALLQKKFPAH